MNDKQSQLSTTAKINDGVTCPTCRLGWWLNPPVKIAGDDENFRCIGCKAVYTRSQIAAPDMLAALKVAVAITEDFLGAPMQEQDHMLEMLNGCRSTITAAMGDRTERSSTNDPT